MATQLLIASLAFLGAQQATLTTISSIDRQPALHVQTDNDLSLLLAAYPSTPIAMARRSSHRTFYWYTPGLNCSADPNAHGSVERSADFVMIDDFGGPYDDASARAAMRRERAVALHNLAMFDRALTPASCVRGSAPPESWSRSD